MRKTEPSITMEGETAIFNDGRGRVVRATPEQLRALYYVYSGWDICANDQEFFIIDLEHAFIVVPDEKGFMKELLRVWKNEILEKKKGFEADTWIPPLKYRKKHLGFLPGVAVKFTIARPGGLRGFRIWKVTDALTQSFFPLDKEKE